MTHRILVLGVTGPTGIPFCEAALKASHCLTLYARTPANIPSTIAQNPNVTIIQGTLDDATKLEEAASSGATVLVSFLGPTQRNKFTGTPVADCYALLWPLLEKHGFTRALILCTKSWNSPDDGKSFKWDVMISALKLTWRVAYAEMNAIGSLINGKPTSPVAWTMFRVPYLTTGSTHPVRATYAGKNEGVKLSRAALAEWVLEEIDAKKWVGKAPMLSA